MTHKNIFIINDQAIIECYVMLFSLFFLQAGYLSQAAAAAGYTAAANAAAVRAYAANAAAASQPGVAYATVPAR